MGRRSRTEEVPGDGWVLPGVVAVGRQHLGAGPLVWDQELHKVGRGQCLTLQLRTALGQLPAEAKFHTGGSGELVVPKSEDLSEPMRGTIVPNLDVLVGDEATEGADQVPAARHVATEPVGSGLRCDVESRDDEHLVVGQVARRRIQEVDLQVEIEQRVIDPAQDIVVTDARPHRCRETSLDTKPLQRRQRLIADQDADAVRLGDPTQRFPGVGELRAQPAGLQVGRIRREVLAENPFPVGLEPVVGGVPMPVHDAVGPTGDVTQRLQPELARIWQPTQLALRLGLQDQIVGATLDRAGQIATEGDLLASQLVLRGVIDVDASDIKGLGDGKMVDGWLQPVGPARPPVEVEIVGDELIITRILPDQLRLPRQEFRHQSAPEPVPGSGERAVDGSPHVGEVLPGVDPVRPVIEPVGAVHCVQVVVEQFAQMLDESALHIRGGGVVVLRLIVDLEADHRFALRGALQESPDDAFGMPEVRGCGDVHYLPGTIAARPLRRGGQHLRMGLDEPGRHRVGGGADDHLDACHLHGINDAVDMAEVEHARLRLAGRPGRFCDAHRVHARRRDHRHVRGQTFLGHVLVVVRCPESNVAGLHGGHLTNVLKDVVVRHSTAAPPRLLAEQPAR